MHKQRDLTYNYKKPPHLLIFNKKSYNVQLTLYQPQQQYNNNLNQLKAR